MKRGGHLTKSRGIPLERLCRISAVRGAHAKARRPEKLGKTAENAEKARKTHENSENTQDSAVLLNAPPPAFAASRDTLPHFLLLPLSLVFWVGGGRKRGRVGGEGGLEGLRGWLGGWRASPSHPSSVRPARPAWGTPCNPGRPAAPGRASRDDENRPGVGESERDRGQACARWP